MATRIITCLSAMAIGTAALSSAAIFSSAAMAMPQSSARISQSVPYSDLDLSSEAGQKTLASRIKSAVRSVCGQPGSRDLKARQLHQNCKTDAARRAAIKSGNVIALYSGDRRMAARDRVIVGN